jgi:nicotinate-nucleotide adenylyltransferase
MVKKNIGLILGSFDPVHIGHLALATTAWNTGEFDEIWMVPAFSNPWKSNQTSFKHRYNMLCQELKDYTSNITANPFELTHRDKIMKRVQKGNVGTCHVLDEIKEQYPNLKFRLIISTETVHEISNWIEGERVMAEWSDMMIIKSIRYTPQPYLSPANTVLVDISSTEIRNMIRDNKTPLPYISSSEYKYIMQNNLYK